MKLILISKDPDGLKRIMETSSTFNIVAAYNSLADHRNELERRMMRIDKLVIVYMPPMNIKRELVALDTLLRNQGSIFRVEEIVYIYDNNADTEHIGMFDAISESIKEHQERLSLATLTNIRSVAVKSEGEVSYAEIRQAIIGVSEKTMKIANTIGVYATGRHSVDNLAFVSAPRDPAYAYPFDTRAIDDYENLRVKLRNSESSHLISEIPQSLRKFDIAIPQYTVSRVVEPRFFVLTGLPSSGTTTYCTALIASALKQTRQIFAIDISETNDLEKVLDLTDLRFQDLDDEEFLTMKAFDYFTTEQLLLYKCTNRNVRYEAIFHVLNHIDSFLRDYIFIDCDLKQLDTVLEALNSNLCFCCVSTNQFENSINIIQNIDFKDSIPFVWLNDSQTFPNRKLPLLPTEIRSRLNPRIHIALPRTFSNFSVEAEVFDGMIAQSGIRTQDYYAS